MRVKRLIIISGFLFLLVTASAYTVPSKIPVQGRLTNASTGVVLSGEYNFTFRIYNASTSGTLLWDENQTLTVDGNGLWNALLGNNTTLSLNFSEDTYLEVELNLDGNPLPRVQLGSTPYAEWTDTAANLSCTDCLGTTEIEDVYLLNTGDNATGDYMFNGSFKIENSSGLPLLYVNSSDGNVGIGTMSPEVKLNVQTEQTQAVARFINHDADGYRGIELGGAPAGAGQHNYIKVYGTTSPLYFTDKDDHFNVAILDTGYVGIGTTSPGTKLQVAGDASLTNAGSADLAFYYKYNDSARVSTYLASGGETFRIARYNDSGAYLDSPFMLYRADGKIYMKGNVGIGTTSPAYLFDVNTFGRARTAFFAKNSGSYGSVSIVTGDNSKTGYIEWRLPAEDSATGTRLGYIGYDASDVELTLENSADFVITGGKVGIGTTSPNDVLDVVGDIDATGCVQTDDSGSIGGTCISDVRFKTNIRPLEGSLERISQLNPVSFEWNSTYYNISSEKGTGVGLIAQELEGVYPELVVTGEDGYKRVRYDIELEMHLIRAVKELKEDNDLKDSEILALKAEKDAEIRQLMDDNTGLENKNEALRRAVCEINPDSSVCVDM